MAGCNFLGVRISEIDPYQSHRPAWSRSCRSGAWRPSSWRRDLETGDRYVPTNPVEDGTAAVANLGDLGTTAHCCSYFGGFGSQQLSQSPADSTGADGSAAGWLAADEVHRFQVRFRALRAPNVSATERLDGDFGIRRMTLVLISFQLESEHEGSGTILPNIDMYIDTLHVGTIPRADRKFSLISGSQILPSYDLRGGR